MKNRIRKLLFTNRASEKLFLVLQKIPGLHLFTFKLIPSNHLYASGSIRKVERNGIKYTLDISDYQEWLIYFNSNTDSSKSVIDYLNKENVILDVGANIGQTSLWIAQQLETKHLNYTVYAFEPHPITYRKLEENLRLNSQLNILPVNIGFGKEENELELVEDHKGNRGGYRIGKLSKSKTGVVVEIQTIDTYVNTNKLEAVDFIKIDVEGFEYQVLQGAQLTLSKWKPTLFVEFCPENLRKQGTEPQDLLAFLKNLGYEIKDANNNVKPSDLSIFEGMTDIVCYFTL